LVLYHLALLSRQAILYLHVPYVLTEFGSKVVDRLRAFQSFIWTCCLAPEPTSEVKFIASWRDRFVPFFTQEIETALSDNETALYQGANASLSISTGSDEVKLTNLRVVGFYVPTGDFVGDNFETGSLVISDELAETYLPFRFDYFDSAVAYLPLDEGIEKQMVAAYMQSHDNPTTGVTYSVDSEPLSQVYYAKMTSQGYGTLLLWAGGILLFFAVLLFANLISTSIEAQKKKSASSAPSALARSTSMASMVSNP